MKHTREPWSFDDYKRVKAESTNEFLGVQVDGFSLSGTDEAKANSRRIVACINACAGLSTERLEKEASLQSEWLDQFFKGRVDIAGRDLELKSQRDELLAALKTARKTARLMHTTDQHETVCIEPQHWRAIMDLIAKYEAKS